MLKSTNTAVHKNNHPLVVVIDTNVIVSALLTHNPQSPTVQVMERVLDGTLSLVANNEILEEYLGVLLRPKFGFNPSQVKDFVSSLCEMAIRNEGIAYEEEMIDPKDRVFYEVALGSHGYLVTGNLKHFPSAPKVVSPAQMIEIIKTQMGKQ